MSPVLAKLSMGGFCNSSSMFSLSNTCIPAIPYLSELGVVVSIRDTSRSCWSFLHTQPHSISILAVFRVPFSIFNTPRFLPVKPAVSFVVGTNLLSSAASLAYIARSRAAAYTSTP